MLKHDRADYDAEEAIKEFEEIRKNLSVSLLTLLDVFCTGVHMSTYVHLTCQHCFIAFLCFFVFAMLSCLPSC